MQFPSFPNLPDDRPMLAIAIFLTYLRNVWEFFLESKKHLFIACVASLLLLGTCVRLWTDTTLPLLADAVPMLVAIAGVVMSYKQPKRESHLMTTVVLLTVGVVGTGIMSWNRIRGERAHKQEVGNLNSRIDAVRDQNGTILSNLASGHVATTQEAELQRRQNIQNTLRNDYILSHDNVSQGLIAGTEFPPDAWMNKRLAELGEKWVFNSAKSSATTTPFAAYTNAALVEELQIEIGNLRDMAGNWQGEDQEEYLKLTDFVYAHGTQEERRAADLKWAKRKKEITANWIKKSTDLIKRANDCQLEVLNHRLQSYQDTTVVSNTTKAFEKLLRGTDLYPDDLRVAAGDLDDLRKGLMSLSK